MFQNENNLGMKNILFGDHFLQAKEVGPCDLSSVTAATFQFLFQGSCLVPRPPYSVAFKPFWVTWSLAARLGYFTEMD